MRKVILGIAGIFLLGAGFAVGWFAALREVSASGQKGAASTLGRGPALERVAQAEQALGQTGFAHAFVYRWQGALLDGYILLDTQEGTKRVSLNSEDLTRTALAGLASESREKGGNQQLPQRQPEERISRDKVQLDPARVRGLIVIAIRPKASGTPGQECIVNLSVTAEGESESWGASTAIISGRLPDFSSVAWVNGRCGLTLADGGARELFELRLRKQ